MAVNVTVCNDTSDLTDLHQNYGFFLKPVAKVNISVQLPPIKTTGKSISNWEVMEKIKFMYVDEFINLKIVKSTLEFIRFEAEVENKQMTTVAVQRLDGQTIKLSGFSEPLKVRCAEAKITFPTRNDWDTFFRESKNMDEHKPGERPDTLHLKDLPSRWFADPRMSKRVDSEKPSEYMLKKVFESYGEVRCVDIPMLDPYRKDLTKSGGITTFSYGAELTFEAFVQYHEYISFVKAMTAFRAMKLCFRDRNSAHYAAAIKIDFDRTKHLSDKSIRKRRLEREKFEALEKEREEKAKAERAALDEKAQAEKALKEQEDKLKEQKKMEKTERRRERQKMREEKRKLKKLELKKMEEERKMRLKIALEERKILIAQRKLESIRLLTVLFERVKAQKTQEELVTREKELEEERKRQIEVDRKRRLERERRKLEAERKKKEDLARQERILRDRILKNLRQVEAKREEDDREKLRERLSKAKAKERSTTSRLKSAVVVHSTRPDEEEEDYDEYDEYDYYP